MELTGGSVAVVTGAASGIGAALGQAFAAAGCAVVLADVEADALAAVAGSIEGDVLAVVTDVSDAAAVGDLADAAFARFGEVHVLCNNAGVSTFNPLTHAVDASRALFNGTWADPQIVVGVVVTTIMAVIALWLASRAFARANA